MNKLPLTEPEISQFAEALGRRLLRMPVIGGVAGHKWLKGTAGYLRPENRETEFIQDLFSLSTPEILLKWYPATHHAKNTMFMWPELPNVVGGPGSEDLTEAQQSLLEKGETLASYTEREISALTPKQPL